MALTAVVTLPLSTVQVEQKCNAVVTVSNSGGSPVGITDMLPTARETGDPVSEDASSVAISRITPGINNMVPAGGSAVFNFGFNVHGPFATTYAIGAQLQASDGQQVTATTATLTVTAVV